MLWDTATLIALPVALLALTVSGAIIVSGLNRRHDLQLCVNSVRAPDRFALGRIPLDSRLIDVASEAEAILRQFAGLAAARHVTLEMAVQPELSVRADPQALREMLFELVDNAVAHAPCGHVLLGAARSGRRVLISVLDDGPGSDRHSRASALRSAERLAALHGAVLDIDPRHGDGTTVTLSLPMGSPDNRVPAAEEVLDPASIWREVSSVAR